MKGVNTGSRGSTRQFASRSWARLPASSIAIYRVQTTRIRCFEQRGQRCGRQIVCARGCAACPAQIRRGAGERCNSPKSGSTRSGTRHAASPATRRPPPRLTLAPSQTHNLKWPSSLSPSPPRPRPWAPGQRAPPRSCQGRHGVDPGPIDPPARSGMTRRSPCLLSDQARTHLRDGPRHDGGAGIASRLHQPRCRASGILQDGMGFPGVARVRPLPDRRSPARRDRRHAPAPRRPAEPPGGGYDGGCCPRAAGRGRHRPHGEPRTAARPCSARWRHERSCDWCDPTGGRIRRQLLTRRWLSRF